MQSNNRISAQEIAANSKFEASVNIGPTLFLDQSEVDFVYDLAPRYNRTFTKTEMSLARSVIDFHNLDFNHPDKYDNIVSYQSVVVTIIDDNYEPITEVKGATEEFNDDQLKLLQSVNYSDDVLIRAEYFEKNNGTGETELSYTTPHITVVPEKQAEYQEGKEAFLSYLKSHRVEESVKITKEDLKPGKIRFTINEKGNIANVNVISSSGYTSVDKTFLKLVKEAPGTWKAATDENGQPVEQQLVFSFGITGC